MPSRTLKLMLIHLTLHPTLTSFVLDEYLKALQMGTLILPQYNHTSHVNTEKKNAKPQRFALDATTFNNAPTTANAGNAHKAGFSLKFLNHAPASTASLFT